MKDSIEAELKFIGVTDSDIDAIIKAVGIDNFRYVAASILSGTSPVFGYTAGVLSGMCRASYPCCVTVLRNVLNKYQSPGIYNNIPYYNFNLPDCSISIRVAYPFDIIAQLLEYSYRDNYRPASVLLDVMSENVTMISKSAYELKSATDALAWLYCYYNGTFGRFKYALNQKASSMFDILQEPAKQMFHRDKQYYTSLMSDAKYQQVRDMFS